MRINRITSTALMIMALLVAACSDPTGPDGSSDRRDGSSGRRLGQLSKDPFVGAVGAVVEVGIVVKDSNMRPVKGESVLWEIAEGRGELLEASTSTNSDGEAWTTIRLDTIAGQLEVIGRLASDQSKSVRVSVIAEPGPAVRVRESSDTVYIMFKQATLMPSVFEDRYGNAITGGRTKWSLAEPESIEIKADSMIGLQKGTISATATLDGITTEVALEVVAWKMIAVGDEHTCGLLSNGQAYCWGNNEYGQLGVENAPEICSYVTYTKDYPCATAPIPVDTDLRFERIWADGKITCASTLAGEAYCWGHNWYGGLGAGIPGEFGDSHPTPIRVANDNRFQLIEGERFNTTCGLVVDGTIYCWGRGYGGAILGDGQEHEDGYSAHPVQVLGGGWKDLTVGASQACALDNAGQVYCWGLRYYMSEGIWASSRGSYLEPTPFPEGYKFKSIEQDGATICGIEVNGNTYCWGHNAHGQLGLGYTDGTHVEPTSPVLGGHQFSQIAGGSSFFCALDIDGKAYCWGRHSSALGSPYVAGKTLHCIGGGDRCTPEPTAVNTDKVFSQIDAGIYHTCALSKEEMLYCWGWSNFGQLGVGMESTDKPELVLNPLLSNR